MFISANKESMPKIESLKTKIPSERPLRGPDVIGYLGEVMGKNDSSVREFFPEIAALKKGKDKEFVTVKFPEKKKSEARIEKAPMAKSNNRDFLTVAEKRAVEKKETLRISQLGKVITETQRKKMILSAIAAAENQKMAEMEARRKKEEQLRGQAFFDIWIKREKHVRPIKQYRVYILKNGFEVLRRNKR